MVSVVISDILKLMDCPVKSQRKVTLLHLRSLNTCVACPKIFPPKTSILQRSGKSGSNHIVKFSKDTGHHIKNRDRKGLSQVVFQ